MVPSPSLIRTAFRIEIPGKKEYLPYDSKILYLLILNKRVRIRSAMWHTQAVEDWCAI